MTREVDSDALSQVARVLGISGIGESGTLFESDALQQTFDVNSTVRRGRADIATGGWFYGVIRNTHAVADDQFESLNPYAPVAGTAVGTWPAVVSDRFDVWVGQATCRRVSGSGTLLGLFTLGPPTRMNGLSSSGAAVSSQMGLARFTAITQVATTTLGVTPEGDLKVDIGMRIPRGAFLQFETTSSAAVVYDLVLSLGLFPIGLGQDIMSR